MSQLSLLRLCDDRHLKFRTKYCNTEGKECHQAAYLLLLCMNVISCVGMPSTWTSKLPKMMDPVLLLHSLFFGDIGSILVGSIGSMILGTVEPVVSISGYWAMILGTLEVLTEPRSQP